MLRITESSKSGRKILTPSLCSQYDHLFPQLVLLGLPMYTAAELQSMAGGGDGDWLGKDID